jgi:uncharacterized protein YjbI with pentapeptide repeats
LSETLMLAEPPGDGARWAAVEVGGELRSGRVADLEIVGSRVAGAILTGVEFERLRATDTVFQGCDLSGTTAVEAVLVRVEFVDCRMLAFDAAQVSLRDVSFGECRLDEANFRMSVGERVQFNRSMLRGADFYRARLPGLRLFDCDLTGVELSRADLRGGRLHGSRLEGLRGADSARGAVIDSSQLLPMALQVLGSLSIAVDDEREPAPAQGRGSQRRERGRLAGN